MPKADVDIGDTVRCGSDKTIQEHFRDVVGVVVSVRFGRGHHNVDEGPPWCNCRGATDECCNPWVQVSTDEDMVNWPSGDWLSPETGKPQWTLLRPPPKFASTEDAERWLNTHE